MNLRPLFKDFWRPAGLSARASHLTLLLMGIGTLALAQQPSRLTLQEALTRADRQNLDLMAARQRRALALAGVQVAVQRPNPLFSFSASRDAPHEGVTIDQPLEIGPKRGRRIDLARKEAVLTDLEIAAFARQVRHSVRNAFYQAEFTKSVSVQKGDLLRLARRLRDIAESRFEAGDVAQFEVIQADLEAARADAAMQLARQEEDVAISRLNALLNESAGTRWDMVSTLEALPVAPPMAQLEERAYQSNSDLQQKKQQEVIEQRRTSLLQAERIPDLSIGIGADLNNPPDYQAGLRGQFSLTLPLFARNQGEIAQSQASQKFLELDLAATKRMIEAEVDSAALEFGARASQVKIFRDTLVPSAERLATMAEEGYKAGKANILTVIDAQRNASQVQQEYLDSLVAAQSAFAALEETVGAPLD